MKEILIFAGTTEGRRLSECLSAVGITHTLCVATEYGEIVLKDHPLVKVHRGRMNQEEITEFIQTGNFAAVVDATHPYAEIITENIKIAMQNMDCPYLRLKRENEDVEEFGKSVTYFDSNVACANALKETEGNILLTTGSKELAVYCSSEELKNRLYVRVLPGIESLTLCMAQGITGKQIMALQGPFTKEMNEAMIRQYRIKYLVTKVSGKNGGYKEKLEAAERTGISVFAVGNTEKERGYSFFEVCQQLENICGKEIKQPHVMDIILAGVGMGSRNNLTMEVYEAIQNADVLLGAERMIAPYQPRKEKKPYYSADQIIPYLKELQNNLSLENGVIVILFSGDSGFYSGCQDLYKALQVEMKTGGLHASIRTMPGISSIAYLAACTGESYHDASIYSLHGKELPNLVRKIKREEKIYLLVSGAKDINRLGKLLMQEGMNNCKIIIGYQLSYPEQQIWTLTPEECGEIKEDGLYTCCIKNPYMECKSLTPGMKDEEFIRDKIPMTKEEVREVSICKLKLHKNAIVYDIGSGTGTLAIEMARLSDDIQVFAIERNSDAICLIEKNKKKSHLDNVSVITAEAPGGFSELPVPTHAFIGGSGGKLKEILSILYQMNSKMRVVINAISMETICEMKEVLSRYPIENEEIIQMQVNKAKIAGQYHLMQGENPIWICSFDFCK